MRIEGRVDWLCLSLICRFSNVIFYFSSHSDYKHFRKEDATWPIAGLGKVTFACFTYKALQATNSRYEGF